jgi:hypothetical protein
MIFPHLTLDQTIFIILSEIVPAGAFFAKAPI